MEKDWKEKWIEQYYRPDLGDNFEVQIVMNHCSFGYLKTSYGGYPAVGNPQHKQGQILLVNGTEWQFSGGFGELRFVGKWEIIKQPGEEV